MITNRKKNGNRFIYKNYEINYSGIVIYKSCFGNVAIEKFIQNEIINDEIAFSNLRGNFIIELKNILSNETIYFTDNSGIYRIYIYENIVSDSFLMLAKQIDTENLTLDHDKIIEFLHLGFIHFDKTFLSEISILPKDEYCLLNANGELRVFNKKLPYLGDKVEIDFDKELSSALQALSGSKNISIDLTGGIDSRLLVAYSTVLNLDFETAISGMPSNSDVKIAKIISKEIAKPFYPNFHTNNGIQYQVLKEIFCLVDGQIDVIGFHRNYQFIKDREKRNINLQVSGVGGELYKDFWWLQDFPFYNKSKSNIPKLFDFRIQGIAFPHDILGNDLKALSQNYRTNIIKELNHFKLNSNTKTYDNIYYNFKMRGIASAYLFCTSKFFNVYAPLLEYDFVRYAYGLKRRKRFFNNFHRQLITQKNKALANIKTTEGVSCSDNFFRKWLDVFGYINNKTIRIIKIILRKIVNKNLLQESPNNPLVYNDFKKLNELSEIEQLLKKHDVINKSTVLGNLPIAILGRLVTIGLLLQTLNRN